MFVIFCKKNCYLMRVEDRTKKQIQTNIYDIIVGRILNKHGLLGDENLIFVWNEFKKHIDDKYDMIEYYGKHRIQLPRWFRSYKDFKLEIEIHSIKTKES
jgi:hypothetical protein